MEHLLTLIGLIPGWLAEALLAGLALGGFAFGVVTNEKSVQFARESETATTKNEADEYGAALQLFVGEFTQSATPGDAASTIDFVKVPPGRWRLVPTLSYLQWDAFGAARTLDVGWTAYNEPDGTVVAADADGIETIIDVSAAGQQLLTGDGIAVGNARLREFNSRDGVTIRGTVLGGTIPAATKVMGYFSLLGGRI